MWYCSQPFRIGSRSIFPASARRRMASQPSMVPTMTQLFTPSSEVTTFAGIPVTAPMSEANGFLHDGCIAAVDIDDRLPVRSGEIKDRRRVPFRRKHCHVLRIQRVDAKDGERECVKQTACHTVFLLRRNGVASAGVTVVGGFTGSGFRVGFYRHGYLSLNERSWK